MRCAPRGSRRSSRRMPARHGYRKDRPRAVRGIGGAGTAGPRISHHGRATSARIVATMPPQTTFDELDRQIIDALFEDARRPFTTVAKDLGVAEATIRARVARL